jgi:epoxyqueuosine reductase
MASSEQIKQFIRAQAVELGFSFVGFSKADFLSEEEEGLTAYLNASYQGKMAYLANHFDLRLDPRKLVPGAKTVISLNFNYFPAEELKADSFKLAKYAYGKDYHDVVRAKLISLLEAMRVEFGAIDGRVFVDSAPVLEKAWAKKSGLGWVGKNGLLIHPKKGSFFFLAEIICDLEVEADGPIKDYCGSCTRCIDACPTDALDIPYVLDASKCITYATIELKDPDIPDFFEGKMEDWVFGCDICQDVCPWNRFSTPHQEPEFYPKTELLAFTKEDWSNLQVESYQAIFKGSAVKRAKYSGLQRNVLFAQKKPE